MPEHPASDGTAALYIALHHHADQRANEAAEHNVSPSPAPITVLHISAAHCVLVSGSTAENGMTRVVSGGFLSVPTLYFRQTPPDEGDLERAIEHVEDAVMPERPQLAPHSQLYSADPTIRQMALLTGQTAAPNMQLSLDEVEALFNRLAARASGRPVSQDSDLPADAEFAATLLILREYMQHLGFATLKICPDTLV